MDKTSWTCRTIFKLKIQKKNIMHPVKMYALFSIHNNIPNTPTEKSHKLDTTLWTSPINFPTFLIIHHVFLVCISKMLKSKLVNR